MRSNELVLVFKHRDLLWKFIRLQCICSEFHKNTVQKKVFVPIFSPHLTSNKCLFRYIYKILYTHIYYIIANVYRTMRIEL